MNLPFPSIRPPIIETTLVESLAVARWRQRRIQGLEKAAILIEASKQTEAIGPAERTTRAWQSLAEQAPWIDRMRLHEARYARQYFRPSRVPRLPRRPCRTRKVVGGVRFRQLNENKGSD